MCLVYNDHQEMVSEKYPWMKRANSDLNRRVSKKMLQTSTLLEQFHMVGIDQGNAFAQKWSLRRRVTGATYLLLVLDTTSGSGFVTCQIVRKVSVVHSAITLCRSGIVKTAVVAQAKSAASCRR